MPDDRTQLEPTVATASHQGWRAWLLGLLASGKSRLGAVGLTLVLGFGAGLLSLYLFADLAEDVKAQESMRLDYGVLDAILSGYIDNDLGRDDLVAAGHDAALVDRVLRMVDVAEYKRRQSAPGTKISIKAFGRDRRLPITNRFREGM